MSLIFCEIISNLLQSISSNDDILTSNCSYYSLFLFCGVMKLSRTGKFLTSIFGSEIRWLLVSISTFL